MALSKLDHVHVTANDPVKAARFFTDVLGGRVISQKGLSGQETVNVDLGGVTVRITVKTGADNDWKGPRIGLHHLGLIVDDLDSVASGMKSMGAEFVNPTASAESGVRYAYIQSPEGVLLELTEDKNLKP